MNDRFINAEKKDMVVSGESRLEVHRFYDAAAHYFIYAKCKYGLLANDFVFNFII